ncbi:conserved hypothetical protein [Desulfamplus magnetovallimortis]|uniref:HTH cro/C1-type domain-containing protein n=1 Tax=Desulfamplus magnetovallimortis TaxID=1246637 RepID=A0A1W1H5W3_9BACT|nr:helix-turn-helix transcriptional regulator [Desulfamplus magnetovallimortis]SLM27842.1 conserved hypothetical protein [Desulfamplus magnetovallimortis]
MAIYYRLKEIMDRKVKKDNMVKITYENVPQVTGISKTTLSRISTGKVAPNADVLEKLCRYFDCGFDDLMNRIDEPEQGGQNPNGA